MLKDFRKHKPAPEGLRLEGFDEIYSVTENPEYDARINSLNLKKEVVGKGKRPDIDTLLYAVIGEAEVALKRKNFETQVEHLHRLVFTIEDRIKRGEDEKGWSEIDRLMAKVEDNGTFGLFERIEKSRIRRPVKTGGDKNGV